MPSQTVNFDRGQMQYIMATLEEEQSFSDRVREVVDSGMEKEQNE